jgi:hypothetical protein
MVVGRIRPFSPDVQQSLLDRAVFRLNQLPEEQRADTLAYMTRLAEELGLRL